MESETPVDVRIFFKDKQNELKGPYTEREVQDWYRQNWFDSSFPFYFMKGDERPTEQTEFLTLDTLRTLNGVGCPFAPVKPESNSEKMEEKIAKLEKELDDLSKKCDGMKELEKRLEDVEKKLKELSTQPPLTSSSLTAAAAPVAAKAVAVSTTAVKKPEKKPEENIEHVRLANAWAAYYLDVLEAYKTNYWNKVDGVKDMQMRASMRPVFTSEPLIKKCREVLLKKLMELDYAYCSECDSIFHNFKQILLHVGGPMHLNESDDLHVLQKVINQTMLEIFFPQLKILTEAEEKHILDAIEKHRHIDMESPDLRPDLDFVDHITFEYRDAIFEIGGNIGLNRAQIVAKMIPRFKQNDRLGRKLMSELHEHIGDALTCCYECDLVTGSRDEYYKHLRTFAHSHKSNTMDLITLVVNMYQKN